MTFDLGTPTETNYHPSVRTLAWMFGGWLAGAVIKAIQDRGDNAMIFSFPSSYVELRGLLLASDSGIGPKDEPAAATYEEFREQCAASLAEGVEEYDQDEETKTIDGDTTDPLDVFPETWEEFYRLFGDLYCCHFASGIRCRALWDYEQIDKVKRVVEILGGTVRIVGPGEGEGVISKLDNLLKNSASPAGD